MGFGCENISKKKYWSAEKQKKIGQVQIELFNVKFISACERKRKNERYKFTMNGKILAVFVFCLFVEDFV